MGTKYQWCKKQNKPLLTSSNLYLQNSRSLDTEFGMLSTCNLFIYFCLAMASTPCLSTFNYEKQNYFQIWLGCEEETKGISCPVSPCHTEINIASVIQLQLICCFSMACGSCFNQIILEKTDFAVQEVIPGSSWACRFAVSAQSWRLTSLFSLPSCLIFSALKILLHGCFFI